ncbi:isochorismate synthase MenF [Mesobacillus zeae]|uniref:Isochorismate synthase MenF n=1 Tax=Mesobacillus zeae TaxID=1917180 RepID=A0A398B5P9_9BACI|nr:isochorismate synthase [Mesobacillus zeae]RID83023.1 isochorismate synthase [Mesobacillus zeae]
MVTIQETELREGILSAIRLAKETVQPVLVSEVQKIADIDPFSFFNAGREQFLGERFFWKDPDSRHIIAGLGNCRLIQHDGVRGRFTKTEKEWNRFIETAVILDEYKTSGTGPLMFGGFSFDPLKEKTGLWSKFSDSHFHVPKYMLTVAGGQAYFTSNVICTQHDDADLYEKVLQERQIILLAQKQPVLPMPALQEVIEIAPEEWKESVSELVRELKDSPLKKVVLARELRLRFSKAAEAESVLFRLLKEQQGSFIFAFESNGDCFIGATPERLVKKEGNSVFSACLAGSIGRGADSDSDEKLGRSLLEDQKNLIEHQYVVDMIREAMEETCDEVIIPATPQLMKMKYIQHLYTPVIGKNRRGTPIFSLVDRLHPTPALGGLPKKLAVEKIREMERLDRGYYAAPLGWLDHNGNGEFAVAIRSALLQGEEASLFAGCGIVADSDADSEYRETSIKFRPMLNAFGGNNL